jgi:hypothetical protein
MKKHTSTPIKVSVLFLLVSILFSCTKDSDLFADVIINEAISPIENASNDSNSSEETEVTVDLVNGIIETNEDVIAVFGISDLASNFNGKSLVLTNIEQPVNGEVEIAKDSIIRYIPNSDFNGTDTFSYSLELTNEDNTVTQDNTSIEIMVKPVSDVVNDEVTVTGSNEVVIPVLNNDTFADKNNVEISSTSEPAKGTVIIRADKSISYTPYANTLGADSFNYNIEIPNDDGSASTEVGTVSLTIASTGNPGDTNMGELLAFPGAEGFGRFTTGGRGQSVYQVTNLNDSGSGSFRDAVSQGNRTIVFRVGGIIRITSNVYFGGSNITVAGQTAPGDGIAIYGGMVDTNQNENIIIRYVNFLAGDNARVDDDDSFRLRKTTAGSAKNFILDHCGFYWGKDETLALESNNSESGAIENVTVQRCIIGESLNDKGMILWRQNYNISVISNLFSNNKERNIRASTRYSTFEMINNVIYNYTWATNPTYSNIFDIIGNVYISSSNKSPVNLEASLNNKPNGDLSETKAHISDNSFNGNGISVSSNLDSFMKNSRQVNSGYVPIVNSLVKNNILNDVGANLNGNNILAQSQIDDVLNNTGSFISSESGSVGLSLSGGTAYPDSDSDGMSDDWEIDNGLNPNDPADSNNDVNGDGYTNLETFLHALTQG